MDGRHLRRLLRALFLVALLQPALAPAGRAQDASAYGAPPRVPYDVGVRHFGSEHGLPGEGIYVIDQTPDGRLWVGTRSGLAYFDGSGFRTVPGSDVLASSAVSNLAMADERSLWATAGQEGVWRVDAAGVERTVEALAGKLVTALLVQHDTLLAATESALWIVPPDSGTVVEHPFGYPVLPLALAMDTTGIGTGVRAIVRAGGGAAGAGPFWVLDGFFGPGLWSPGAMPHFIASDQGSATVSWIGLHRDEDGTVWALHSATGLHRIDPGPTGSGPDAARLERVMPAVNSKAILGNSLVESTLLTSHDGVVYVMSDRGVLRWSAREGRALPPLSRYPSLANVDARTVYRDHEGGLWIGSTTGVYYVPSPGVLHVREVGGRPLFQPGIGHRPLPGSPWMDTKGSGLLDLRTMSLVTPGGHLIWYLPQSQEGRVHAYGPDSRFVLDGEAWHELPHEHLWAYEPVRYGAIGRDGLVYIFGYEGLYLHADVGHPEEGPPVLVFPNPSEERAWQRYAFTLAPDGAVVLRARDLILTGRAGPGPSLRLDTLAVVPGIAEARGWAMVADRVGRVWLGLWKDGLVVIEGGVATRLLPNADGLSQAGDGVIVAKTDDGIVGFDEASMALLFSLGKEDGLLTSSAWDAMFYGDTLYVAHEQGLSLVPRSSLSASIPVPRVLLEAHWTDERRRALELEFVATTYRAPGRLRYEYRLDDEAWEPAAQTSLLLAGLAPGAHAVAVRARHELGPFGPVVSHAFVVPTPFYRATWFTALLALLVVGVAAGGYRLRMRAVRRKEATLVALVHERTHSLAEAMQTLAEAKETTEEQARQLAELDQLKSRFFANISHELRTPLTLIIAPLQDVLADERGLSSRTRRAIEGPLQSARRLSELVDQILRLSRLEASDARLDLRPVDLGALLRARVRAFAPVAACRRIALTADTPPEPVVVRLDPEAMTTVMDNLLSNALKYTPEGGRVRGTLVPDGAHAVLAVEDTGPGIPPEALPHVFERFYRAADGEPGGATPSAGTGIGLDLAHELVLLHEGTIGVESELGVGTVFTVRLPFEAGLGAPEPGASAGVAGDGSAARTLEAADFEVGVPERDAGGAPAMERAGERETVGPDAVGPDAPSVLIVEDNDAVRAYLAERLGRHFRVLTASDGVEGLAAARTHAPDLVVSDVMMPRMDGLALCRALKADDALAAVPVVLLTARASPEHAVEGLGAGADDYMEKPFESAELVARIRRHLARNAALSARYGRRILVGPQEVEATSADAAFLERLTFVLEERHHEPSLSVEDVAFELGVSPRQFRRRLGALTARSPSEHLRSFRLARAAQLLGAGAGTVSETAYRVGFSNARVFARQFRAHFGCAPSAYEGPGGGPGGDGTAAT